MNKDLGDLNDEKIKELNNLCDLKFINVDKKKLKYASFIFNVFYPSMNTVHFIKNISKYDYNLGYLKKLLDNPFLHPLYENSIQTYFYYLKNKKNNIYESKIFWNNFFLANNVNTPNLKAIIVNGKVITNYSSVLKIVERNKNDPKKILDIITILKNKNKIEDIINQDVTNYDNIFKHSIIKPNYGRQGIGIKVYKNYNSIPSEGIFLIQERIRNTTYNGHFRLVTYWNKENNIYKNKYNYLFIQEDKTKIQSNAHEGATVYEVNDDKVRKLTEKNSEYNLQYFNYSYSLLKQSTEKAIELHKKLDTIIIGWDVKITKDKYYFLEGNFGAGNIFFDDCYYLDKLDFISKIKYD